MSNIAGIQTMLNTGYKKEFSKIIMIAAVINLAISFIIVPVFFEIGSATSVVITEIYVTLAMILFLLRKGIKII